MTSPLPELLKLSVAERIQLVEDIWDSTVARMAEKRAQELWALAREIEQEALEQDD